MLFPLARYRSQTQKGHRVEQILMITSDLRRVNAVRKSAIRLSPRIARVGRDLCSSPIGALIAARRSLILQKSADRVPGDCLEERVEQRRQADVHIQNRPLYFLLSLHPRIYRSPRNTFSSHHASIIISSIRSFFSTGSSTRHSLAQRTKRHPRTQLFFVFFSFFN